MWQRELRDWSKGECEPEPGKTIAPLLPYADSLMLTRGVLRRCVPQQADVPIVLREVANHYRQSASELASAWQDRMAGAVWSDLARILERAADSTDKAIRNRLGVQ